MNNQPVRNQDIRGAGLCVATPRPSTQVSAYLGELTGELDALDKAIQVHAERISPVLSPGNPSKGCDEGTPEEILCDTADRLRSAVKRLAILRGQLEELTRRTEA